MITLPPYISYEQDNKQSLAVLLVNCVITRVITRLYSFYRDYLQHLLTSFQWTFFHRIIPSHNCHDASNPRSRLDVARRDVAAEMEHFLQMPMDPDVSCRAAGP